MNIGLAFSYIFNDKDWLKKILMPALCGLIPIVGQFVVIGWGLKAAKNVIDGNAENALPELEFGADLRRGFLAFLIQAIYLIPIGIIFGIAGGLFAGSASTEDIVSTLLMILGGCIGLVGLVIAIVIAFMSMAGLANFVAKGEFGAAFKFKDVFAMVKMAFVTWLLLAVLQGLVAGIIAPLGTIICVIGVIFTLAFAQAVNGHLLGQAYNKANEPVLGEVEVL